MRCSLKWAPVKALSLKGPKGGVLCIADNIYHLNLPLHKLTAKELSLGAEPRTGAAALCQL